MTVDIFKDWRTADLAARTAEKAMFKQTMLAFDGLSSATSMTDAQHVKVLRQRANDLFHLAMATSKALSGVPVAAAQGKLKSDPAGWAASALKEMKRRSQRPPQSQPTPAEKFDQARPDPIGSKGGRSD